MCATSGIWIIDGDTADRKIIRRYLHRSALSCQVTEFPSVGHALAASPERPPEIVFLDYVAAGALGQTAMQRLLSLWPDLAVIVVTGQDNDADFAEACHSGATDCIQKRDLNESAVLRSVGNALRLARLRSRIRAQNHDLEAFVHVLVHEMAAPIRGVDMLADVLAEQAADRDLSAVARTGGQIQDQAQRMSALLKSLRTYAFIDQRTLHECLSAENLAVQAVESLRQEIGGAKAVVEIGNLPFLYGDRTQLTLLFRNLIANGIKFQRGRAPVVHVRSSGGAGSVAHLSISDNGIGMSRMDLQNVFQPFRRLNHASEFAGSGLGLATCARIVAHHRGRIRVESTLGQGTQIHIELPTRPTEGALA